MLSAWWLSIALCALSLSTATRSLSQAGPVQTRGGSVHKEPRNPRGLRATQLLERRPHGAPVRVRFEWEQVAGVREYLLAGQWVTPPSWTISRREYRVNAHNAVEWTAQRVGFETSIPEGSHSWSVLSISGKDSILDRATATPFSFDLR